MTRLLVALMLSLSAGAVSAASPEQDYLATRDAYTKSFEHGYTGSDIDRHQRALADLEARLRRIVGPSTLKGFPAEGKIHLDTLSIEDEGFGLLDGLAYAIALDDKGIDEKVRIVVTTRGLFDAWLRAHKAKQRAQERLPQDLQAALKTDDFYRQALSTDAAVITYAQLPVAKPSWAKLAVAMLATRTQDLVGSAPTEMDIAVIGSERVYLVAAKTEVAVGPIAACDAIRQRSKARADAVRSGSLATQLEARGMRAFMQCYATSARDAEGFAAAVKQAQALIELLPAK